jgi:hypothetical protein
VRLQPGRGAISQPSAAKPHPVSWLQRSSHVHKEQRDAILALADRLWCKLDIPEEHLMVQRYTLALELVDIVMPPALPGRRAILHRRASAN